MTHYVIEKDVPIPPYRSGVGRKPTIPHYVMVVGDSVSTPKQIDAARYSKDGRMYLCLPVQEDGESHFRTWRTA